MRRALTGLGLGLALGFPFVLGCHLMPKGRDRINPPPAQTQATPASLVNYLNRNSAKVQSVRCKVDMDCKMGRQAVGVGGVMACQKPRDFRLRGDVLGQPACDVGSNANEFWYWISKAPQPYVYHCSYRDLATGKVNVPFPFQPDMVMAALGIADYDPNAKYELKPGKGTLELVQDTISPSGQAVKRSTVFKSTLARPGEPQVIAHTLRDQRGGLICKADIHKVEVDPATEAVLPTQVTIEWPAQQVTMKLYLSGLNVNAIDRDSAGKLFQRADLRHEAYDLARGVVSSPTGLRRAGATLLPPRK
jgi:hypothetical protein